MGDVHAVDLFQRASLRLANEEEDHEDGEQISCCKDISISVVDGTSDVWREEGDQKVEGPVASSGKTHGGGTVPRRVDLGDESPDDWTPGGRVE